LSNFATSAFWPLPKNSQRAFFLTVGPLLIGNSLFCCFEMMENFVILAVADEDFVFISRYQA
jgi:hypothetical protein